MWGVSGRALSHPRLPALWAGCRGPLPTGCGCGGVRAWGPVTNPTVRALASWLCTLSGRHEGARGGHLLPGCGASGVGRSPTRDHPSFRACSRGPLPTGRGWGVRAWGPGCPWHLVPCRGSSCVVRASRVRGTRWQLWLGTCPRAVVVAGGVPLWRAWGPNIAAPLLVRSGRSRCSSRLSYRRGAFPHSGGCRPRLYWVAARGKLRPAEYRAHCACRWPLPRQGRWARSASYPFGAPRWGCPWRFPPASVLGCVRCCGLACVDPVTDASGFSYRPSCNRGLGRCTGAVSCGRQHRPLRVGGRHARVPRVCACACPAWPGRAGRPPGRVLVCLILSFGRSWFALCLFGPLRAGVAPFMVVVVFFLFLFPFSSLLRPRCVLLCVFSGPGCLGPWRLVPPPFFPSPPSVRPLSPALRVFRPGVPWALASCCPPPSFFLPPPPSLLSLAFPAFRLPWASAPPLSFLFVFFPLVSCFFFFFFFFPFFPFFFAGCALRGGFVCLGPSGVPRWCCPCRCSVCAGSCCVVLAIGPGFPLLSAGGSWCRALVVLSRAGRVARRPVVRCGVSWCPAALCCVLLRGAVVWWCAVVPCRLFASLPVPVVCFLPLRVCFLRSGVSCCVFPVLSVRCAVRVVSARSPLVPCSPVLCLVVLCCRVVPWCPVLPPCWVCFLRGCGCTYLKNRCEIS